MDRDSARELMEKHIKTVNLRKHSLSVEAGMRKFARLIKEDEDRWALAGLLHDLDYEYTSDKPEEHGFKTVEMLKDHGFDDMEILDAIIMHSGNLPASSKMGQALYAVDPLTGFLVACALMHPTKKLEGLNIDFIMRRFEEKRFAGGASRTQMRSIEKHFDISVENFIKTVLEAMREKHEILGL